MQRFKTRPQFQEALAGSLIAKSTHFALHRAVFDSLASKNQPPLFPVNDIWIGAMVPKRWAKRAVTRNAIKRQIYTVSAEFELSLTESAHVVRLRSGFDRAQFVSATSDVLKLAVRAELLSLFGRAQGAVTR